MMNDFNDDVIEKSKVNQIKTCLDLIYDFSIAGWTDNLIIAFI